MPKQITISGVVYLRPIRTMNRRSPKAHSIITGCQRQRRGRDVHPATPNLTLQQATDATASVEGRGQVSATHRRKDECCIMAKTNAPRPGAGSLPPPAFTPRLTRWQIRETRRRKEILAAFDLLLRQGNSKRSAARQLRQPYTNLWRWRKRVVPLPNLGRKSSFAHFVIPRAVVYRVQRLQMSGMGNAKAWRAVATKRICPSVLRGFLLSSRHIPPSFLRETRLVRMTLRVAIGASFCLIENLRFERTPKR